MFVILQVVHPKSDSQRKSLLEAVKEILLFRSLDQEQLAEVLDAMFERKVSPEEYIIRQVKRKELLFNSNTGFYSFTAAVHRVTMATTFTWSKAEFTTSTSTMGLRR